MAKLKSSDFLVSQFWGVIESAPGEQDAVAPSLIEVLGEVIVQTKHDDDEGLVRPDAAKLRQICSDLLGCCVRVGDEEWGPFLANDLRRLERELCAILDVEPFKRPDGVRLRRICSELHELCVRVNATPDWKPSPRACTSLANDLRRLEKELCAMLGVEPFGRPLVWADQMDPPKQAGNPSQQ
jgi:hypothetical protein